jgi:hypothetical protein
MPIGPRDHPDAALEEVWHEHDFRKPASCAAASPEAEVIDLIQQR